MASPPERAERANCEEAHVPPHSLDLNFLDPNCTCDDLQIQSLMYVLALSPIPPLTKSSPAAPLCPMGIAGHFVLETPYWSAERAFALFGRACAALRAECQAPSKKCQLPYRGGAVLAR